MTRNRDHEARMRGRKSDFRTDISGGHNSIAPNAKIIHNHYNYAGSTDAAVRQELEKYYRKMVDEAQREIDECPGLDILHLKYFLLRVLPPEYHGWIDRLRRRQAQGSTYNISIGGPDNDASRAQTATIKDRFLPPPTAVNG